MSLRQRPDRDSLKCHTKKETEVSENLGLYSGCVLRKPSKQKTMKQKKNNNEAVTNSGKLRSYKRKENNHCVLYGSTVNNIHMTYYEL